MKKNQHSYARLIRPLVVLALLVVFSNTNGVFAQNWDEIIKTVASDRGAEDEFGISVAISGDYAIVGARREDEDTTGGNTLGNAGSAYIIKNIAGSWTEVQKLVASDREANDEFGWSVAISGDYAIVGAFAEGLDTAGSAYIFKNNAGTWSEVQKLVASDRGLNDRFGWSVAISGDYAIIGAPEEDEDTTGGNTLNAAGSAYIFKNNAGTWSEVEKLVASDRRIVDVFGYSVAISGDYVIVGAFLEDEDTTGGNTLSDAGSAYIFKNNSGNWTEVQKIVALDRGAIDWFGHSVAISGDYVIVSAFFEDEDTTGGNTLKNAGSAYIFKNNAGTWSQVQKIVASDRNNADLFGWYVAISGDYAIVGAYAEGHDTTGGNPLSKAGSAYIFKNNTGSWSEVQKIVASDRGANDQFGISVAISGDYAIVGAYAEGHDTTGGNTLLYAGSAYFFSCATRGTDVQTACDSFTWIDNVTYTTSNNTATHILINATGCDSVVTLNLTINSNTGTDFQTACNSFTWIDGITYTLSNNTAIDTLINAAGCDSIVTLDLTINNSTIGTDVQTACDSFTWIDGITYTLTNNTAKDTLINAAGCDSIVTLDLTIYNSTIGTDVQTACDSFTWIDNVTYTTSNNIATHTLINTAGCDSVVTLDLTINNSTSNDTVTVCDRYTWNANNLTYTTSGTYLDTLTNAAGCDSVLMLNLTIDSVSDLTITTSGLAIMANNTNATYQWLDCNNAYAIIVGETGQTFIATANGNYAVELTENGCVDTSACVRIITVGIIENSLNNNLLVYPNPTAENFTIDLGAVYERAQISINDISGKLIDSKTITHSKVLKLSIEEPAGIYIVSIQAGNKKAVIRLVKE